MFQFVPNLETLDISYNNIKHIQVPLLKNVPKLVELRADGNPLKCNIKNLAVQNYTKIHKILYTSVCNENITPKKVHKFEKIIMGDNLESTTTMINRKNSWISDEKNQDNTTVNKCQNQKEEESSEDDNDEKSLLMIIIELSPWLVCTMIFVNGVLFGK